jgi:flavin reductase (DIM6/NTAB) family NADH-FMN oxidoreductase RutF
MVQPRSFHEIVSRLDYPMIVVTAAARGERSGCLVGFHTQVSIEPALFLVCISWRNQTSRVAARSEHLAVHFLGEHDLDLAVLFGAQTGDAADKFAACAWENHRYGVPLLTKPAAWFVGRVLERLTLGDHVGHLLEPVDARLSTPVPQLGFQHVKGMQPGHEA